MLVVLTRIVCKTGSLALLLAIAPLSATADVLPLSGAYPVHASRVGFQWSADVVPARRGGFLVAWGGLAALTPPPYGASVFEREFNAEGLPRFLERGLSDPTFPDSSDQFVRLARTPLGRRIAVWTNEIGRDGDGRGVFGALFDRRGTRVRGEFQVNRDHTDGDQEWATAAAGGGTFLIAWSDYATDGVRVLVSAQRFARSGDRLGAELTLASRPEELGLLPRAAALNGDHAGDYIVVWESAKLDDPEAGYDAVGRIVRRDGSISERLILGGESLADEGSPSVAATETGFVVAWTRYSASGVDVHARQFTNDATPIADGFRVNTYTSGNQYGPNLATAPNGDFVIVWSSGSLSDDGDPPQDGDGFGLYAQAYAADGSRLGKEFQVSTEFIGWQVGDPGVPGITFVNDTDFVAVWSKVTRRFDPDVHMRRFRLSHDRRLCGDTVGADLTIGASDALGVLRAAVQLVDCDPCSCDADGSGAIGVQDAQFVLRLSIGLLDAADCPLCG